MTKAPPLDVPASLSRLAKRLFSQRNGFTPCRPLSDESERFVIALLQTLFPTRGSTTFFSASELQAELTLLRRDLQHLLLALNHFTPEQSGAIAEGIFGRLGPLHHALLEDAQAILDGDPAAASLDEVILAYPGFQAIATYRLAHLLWAAEVPLLPRLFSEFAHRITGVDIHPAATIGPSFCIDHGTGIVIGATTHIGAQVKLYQGVTLGALSVDKSQAGQKRHPTIGDRVVIYAQAVILGGDTVVGSDSIIGGNVWLTHSVPPHSLVTHQIQTRVCSRLKPSCCLEEGCPAQPCDQSKPTSPKRGRKR